MARKSYPPVTLSQVQSLIDLTHRAERGERIAAELAQLMPLSSIVSIEERGDRVVAVEIAGRTPRIMDDVAALLLCVFSIPSTAPIFNPDRNKDAGDRKDYLYCPSYGNLRVAFQRVLVDAKTGKQVRLGTDHYDLRPSAGMSVTAAPEFGMGETTDARSKALDIALMSHAEHAKKLGIADLLPGDAYRELILNCYRLCDARFAPFLRSSLPTAAE